MDDWPLQWFRNYTGSEQCTGGGIDALCGETNQYFQRNDTGGFLYTDPHSAFSTTNAGNHQGCNPMGTVVSGIDHGSGNNLGTQECGFAQFRFYCTETANVDFRAEMSYFADGRGPNDDSFWTSLDGDRTHGRVWGGMLRQPNWGGNTAFGNPMRVEAGAHIFGVAEREDGASIRRIYFVDGFPQCQFGEPPANLTQQFLEFESTTTTTLNSIQTNLGNRVSSLESSVSSLTDQLSTVRSNTMSAISSQVAQLRTDLTGQINNVQSTVDARRARVQRYSVANGGSNQQSPSVEASGQDLVLNSGGNVLVSGSSCRDVDVCDLAQAFADLTQDLRQQ